MAHEYRYILSYGPEYKNMIHDRKYLLLDKCFAEIKDFTDFSFFYDNDGRALTDHELINLKASQILFQADEDAGWRILRGEGI